MDRQTLTLLVGLVVVMVGGGAMQSYVTDPFWKQYTGLFLMGFLFALIVGQEMVFRLTAASFFYVEMTVRPRDEELRLMVKQITCTRSSSGEYLTRMQLAYDNEFKPYGNVREFTINSTKNTNPIFRWAPGKAYYKGYEIDHPNTVKITVREQEESAVRLERGERIPTLYLREGPNYIESCGIVLNSNDKNINDKLTSIVSEVTMLRGALSTAKAEAHNEHKLRVHAEEIVGDLTNEQQSLLKQKDTVNDLALIKIMVLIKIVQTLERVKDQLQRGKTNIILKYLVPGIIAGLIILFLWSQPQIADKLFTWLSVTNNQIFVLVSTAISGAIIYYIMKRRR